jgi:predicted Zn-dependent peptidase
MVGVVLLLGVARGAGGAGDGVRMERLDNGFTVLVRENPVAPVVALSLLVRMGTRWETTENTGISNFLQAVMVTGTTKRSGGELADAVTALGGKLSASGDLDYSEIRASALARFWRELLGLTAELALEPKLAPAEVDRERAYLIRRVQRRLDNPLSGMAALRACLRRHPTRCPPGHAGVAQRIDTPPSWRATRFCRPRRMVRP